MATDGSLTTASDAPARPGPRRKRRVAPALLPESARKAAGVATALAFITVLTFARCLDNGFVNYDDETYTVRNPYVAGVAEQGPFRSIWWAVTSTERAANWHPLTWISLELDGWLYREPDRALLNPWGFHLTNVLLHAAGVALLFGVLRAMTGALWPAALATALFALHPLRVESVAWVAERKDVLSGLLFALTLWAYTRYAAMPTFGLYAALFAVFCLGLTAKPMLVTVPFVLYLLDYWPLARRGSTALSRLLAEKAVLLVPVIGSCAVTVFAQRRGHALRGFEQMPLGDRVGNAVVACAGYLGKMVWPVDLAVFYRHPAGSLSPALVVVAALTLVGTSAFVWVYRGRPYLPTGWLWYMGMLVPVIGLVQVGIQSMADRYTYLPSIGIALAVAWGLGDLVAGGGVAAIPAVAWSVAALATCAGLTWNQIGYWHDSVTLWTHAVAAAGDSDLAQYNLGQAVAVEGDRQAALLQAAGRAREAEAVRDRGWDEAARHFRRALEVNPEHREARHNLGVYHAKVGRLDEAVRDFQSVVRIAPDFAEARYHLGMALARQRRLDAAAAEFRTALRLQPDHVAARLNLAGVLFEQGRSGEAVAEYEELLGADPVNWVVYNKLGQAFARQGQWDQALRCLKQALRINPRFAPAYDNLGTVYELTGAKTNALACFRKAVELEPQVSQHWYDLAHVYAEMGAAPLSQQAYARARQLDPAWPTATNKAAWQRATSAQAGLRNGAAALRLARQVCEAGGRRPEFLETLAAAYAETGDFRRARETQREAIAAVPPGQDAQRPAMQARLELYVAGTPYRDAAASPER